MTYITTTVSREKLKSKDFDFDSMVIKESNTVEKIGEREFYAPAVELLALIWAEAGDPRVD